MNMSMNADVQRIRRSVDDFLAAGDLAHGHLDERALRTLLGALSWVQLNGIGRSWGADRASGPEELIAQWLRTALGVGRVAVVISSDGQRLRWRCGSTLANGTADTLRAEFEDAVVDGVSAPPLANGLRCLLRGVPSPSQLGLVVDSLVRLREPWQLVVTIEPVTHDQLAAERKDIGALIDAVQPSTTRNVTVTATESRTEHDNSATHQLAQLTRLHQRLAATAAHSAAWVSVVLAASSQSALNAVVAKTLNVLASGRRPIRTLRRAEPHSSRGAAADLWTIDEVARLVAPPSLDVPGFAVTPWARFDRHADARRESERYVRLGQNDSGVNLDVDLDMLAGHLLVGGITGTGKTSMALGLLHELDRNGVPWTVIEPAKTDIIDALRDAATVVEPALNAIPLNPLWFPPGIELHGHLQRVVAILCASFGEDTHPLPEVLTQAAERAYADRGWDLATGTHPYANDVTYPCHPTLHEVRQHAFALVDRNYSGEVRTNVRGFISTRLGALLSGAAARCFDTDQPVPLQLLFGSRTVVNLRHFEDQAVRDLLCSLLFIWLGERRAGHRSRTLEHLLVIEEAHRVFAAPPAGENPSPAVRLLGDHLAELRSSGQGIALIDQSWSTLARNAEANTNTKIALAMPATDDIERVAAIFALDAEQRLVAPVLPAHSALVLTAGMDRVQRIRTNHRFALEPRQRAAQPDASRKGWNATVVSGHFDGHAQRLADLSVAATGDSRAAALAALSARLATVTSQRLGRTPDQVDDAHIQALVRQELSSSVERVGRNRRLVHQQRIDALEAIHAGDVEHVVTSGAHPKPACAAVCATGNCPVREIGVTLGASVRERVAERTPPNGTVPATVLHAVRRVVVADCEPIDDIEFLRTLVGCSLLHALEPHLDPRRLEPVLRDAMGGSDA